MGKKLLFPIAVLAIIITISGVIYLSLPKPGFPGTEIIADHPQLIYSSSNGKPTLIYFSAPNCPACILEDTALDRLNMAYNQSVNFIYLKFNSELSKVFEDWSVIKVPTIILADNTGTIVKRFDGEYIDENVLRAELKRIV